MANQFDSSLVFYSIAWKARDEKTGITFVVKELGIRATWVAFDREANTLGKGEHVGRDPAKAARAACRRFLRGFRG